jgi:hypothetical protein
LNSDQLILSYRPKIDTLATQLKNGSIDINRWLGEFKDLLKDLYVEQYYLGSKKSTLNVSEQLLLSSLLIKQYKFMEDLFANDISFLTLDQVKARMNYYLQSSGQSFEQGVLTNVQDLPVRISLPAYPRDGSTLCLIHCRCRWKHEFDSQNRWIGATWVLNDNVLHCDTCPSRAVAWNPLILIQYDSLGRPYRV